MTAFEQMTAAREIADIDRTPRLIDFIKTETRWQILALRPSITSRSIEEYKSRRQLFIWAYAQARRRTPVGKSFYQAVGDLGFEFASLIVMRANLRSRARQ